MPNQAVTKIKSKDSNSTEETFNLGANFDNVYYSDENEYTLKDFFEYIQNFLESPLFIQYSTEQPIVDSVKVWYDINETPAS